MASVVFLRAANVGKHNRFQPSVLAKELARFGMINIGAVGTFVVRKDVSEKTLRAAILRKLPIKCDMMICRAQEIVDLVRDNPLKNEPTDKDRRILLTVMSERPGRVPRLPIHAPSRENWEVKIVRIQGRAALSLWRRLRQNALYPSQVLEKQFGVITTTRSWSTIEKVAQTLQAKRRTLRLLL
jgi:uncharacterized protein (DUF1697 family)